MSGDGPLVLQRNTYRLNSGIGIMVLLARIQRLRARLPAGWFSLASPFRYSGSARLVDLDDAVSAKANGIGYALRLAVVEEAVSVRPVNGPVNFPSVVLDDKFDQPIGLLIHWFVLSGCPELVQNFRQHELRRDSFPPENNHRSRRRSDCVALCRRKDGPHIGRRIG